ncbi:MAG: shikimate dehydrogenase [Victivallaceae bacterium]|nr:shikimate dehydrogenase [Victivallaceae bacterium]
MDFSPLQNVSYCVIGDPIGHSVSPAMQNAAFAVCGEGTPYGKMRVPLEEIGPFFEYARHHLRGVNVTVPLKEAAAEYADFLAPSACQAHSVNTLVISGGRIEGHSTDGYGLLTALKEAFGFAAADKTLLFLGAGGAARAAAFALAGAGAKRIAFLNRSPGRAETLARELRETFPRLDCVGAALDDGAARARFFGAADLVLQSTSLGWRDDDPAVTEIPDTRAAFFDFVYRDTHFLREARRRGLACADGRGMLLHQGAESFRLWTGKDAPVDAMRRALEGLK